MRRQCHLQRSDLTIASIGSYEMSQQRSDDAVYLLKESSSKNEPPSKPAPAETGVEQTSTSVPENDVESISPDEKLTQVEIEAAPAPVPHVTPPAKPHGTKKGRGGPFIPMLLVAAAAAGIAWGRKKLMHRAPGAQSKAPKDKAPTTRRKASSSQKPVHASAGEANDEAEVADEPPPEPDAIEPMLKPATVIAPSAMPPNMPPPPLHNLTFVVSEDLELEGVPTSDGVPAWRGLPEASSGSIPAVKRLLAAGATCLGKSTIQPFGLDMLGDNVGCALNRTRVAGGACTGGAGSNLQSRWEKV